MLVNTQLAFGGASFVPGTSFGLQVHAPCEQQLEILPKTATGQDEMASVTHPLKMGPMCLVCKPCIFSEKVSLLVIFGGALSGILILFLRPPSSKSTVDF